MPWARSKITSKSTLCQQLCPPILRKIDLFYYLSVVPPLKPILTKIKTGTWKNTNRHMYLKVFFPRLRTLQK
jgi:hypothetical protein